MKKQRGIGLLEVLAAITILSASVLGLARMAGDANTQNKGTITAQHFKQVMDASSRYVQDNTAVIQAAATATSPVVITVQMLKTTNYLSSAFRGKNPYGQTVQVEVLQPVPGNLQAISITMGGTAIPDGDAPAVATKVGASGGYTAVANPTVAQGSYAGWLMPLTYNTQPGAGHLVGMLYFNNGQLVSDYLRRHAVPGHPELNTMYTPINMKAIATENTSDALCIVGDATTYGRIAADANGAVLSCQNGTWRRPGSSFWKNPVATFAALPLTDPVGTVRMTTNTARAFMYNGTSWTALAVDQNGNLTIPGTMSAAASTVTGTMTAGKAQLNDVVVENTACSPNGLLARNSTGLMLSCQSGVWEKQFNPASFVTAISNSAMCAGGCAVSTSAACPGTTALVTGGCSLFGNGPANTNIFSSYPSGNFWICSLWNGSAAANGIQARVTCQ